MKAGISEIQKLCNLFDVSFDYIFNNQGGVFKQENASPKSEDFTQVQYSDLQAQNASPFDEFDQGVDYIKGGAELLEESPTGIPLIPIHAAAGILSGSSSQIMEYECEHYVIPGFNKADFLIRIAGDSMQPRYLSGDIVACQKLPRDTFFQWNKVYAIDCEQGVIIKRIKRSTDEDHIMLVSDNAQYDPVELHKSKVFGVGKVIGLVRLED